MSVQLVVVGLGNPGAEYADTRHNVGWMVLDCWAEQIGGITWREGKWQAAVARDAETLLVKPQTYMNHSGQAVRAVLAYHRLTVAQLVVVHDDLDLPFGTIKRSEGSGSAGHRGVADVIAQLGTDQFRRVRIGIGRPSGNFDATDYVLSQFSPDQRAALPGLCAQAITTITHIQR